MPSASGTYETGREDGKVQVVDVVPSPGSSCVGGPVVTNAFCLVKFQVSSTDSVEVGSVLADAQASPLMRQKA